MLRAALGPVGYLILVGLLSLGIATAVRDSATAIGITLGLISLFPITALEGAGLRWQRLFQQATTALLIGGSRLRLRDA